MQAEPPKRKRRWFQFTLAVAAGSVLTDYCLTADHGW
jgi:hypothetical protein